MADAFWTDTFWMGEVTHKHKELPDHLTEMLRRGTPEEALSDAVERRHILYAEFGDGMGAYANEYHFRNGKPVQTGNFIDADEA